MIVKDLKDFLRKKVKRIKNLKEKFFKFYVNFAPRFGFLSINFNKNLKYDCLFILYVFTSVMKH